MFCGLEKKCTFVGDLSCRQDGQSHKKLERYAQFNLIPMYENMPVVENFNKNYLRMIIKSHIILVFFMYYLSIENVNAQKINNRRYIVWFAPSKATHVYGVRLNFWSLDDSFGVSASRIYGLELNMDPLCLLLTCTMLPVHAILDIKNAHGAHDLSQCNPVKFSQFDRINGLQIGSTNGNNIVNGLNLSAACFDSNNNGVCISAVMNRHYVMNGVSIAVIANHDTKCNGLQISLVNTSKKLKGVQIGLWNINQKRSLPFVNWCFSSQSIGNRFDSRR